MSSSRIPFIVGGKLNLRKRRKKRGRNAPRVPRFTLEEAFCHSLVLDEDEMENPQNADLSLERAIRSVAFLLHSLSEDGCRTIDGLAAEGLGSVLDHYANQIGRRAGRGR